MAALRDHVGPVCGAPLTARPRVLVVEDDPGPSRALAECLEGGGYAVDFATGCEASLAAAHQGSYDLVVLDIGQPRGRGLDACRELRRLAPGTSLIIVAAAQATDRAIGLRLGADDYLTKPFEVAELAARVEACLRRRVRTAAAEAPRRFGDVVVDLARAEVSRAGRHVPLSAREFQLLRCLAQNAGKALSRDVLLDSVWGRDASPLPRTVDVHVAWLRRKLETNPHHPTLIRTLHGVGYVFAAENEEPRADPAPSEAGR